MSDFFVRFQSFSFGNSGPHAKPQLKFQLGFLLRLTNTKKCYVYPTSFTSTAPTNEMCLNEGKNHFVVLSPPPNLLSPQLLFNKHVNFSSFLDTPQKKNWVQTCPTYMCWPLVFIVLHINHPQIHRKLHKLPEKVTRYSFNMQSHHIQPYEHYVSTCSTIAFVVVNINMRKVVKLRLML